MVLESLLANRIHPWLEQPSEARKVVDVHFLNSSLGTSVGRVRDENEDRAIILRASFSKSPAQSFLLFAICDGMGGMSEGSDCAKLALSNFVASVVSNREGTLRQRAYKAVHTANSVVYDRYKGRGGTTLSAIIFNKSDGAFGINVGDSRIYEYSWKNHFKQLSTDDTIEAALAKLKSQQIFGLDNGFFTRRLAQFIGIGEGLQPQIFRLKKLFGGTGFIITSDGAHQVAADTMSSIVLNSETPLHVVSRITYLSEWCGGTDNATVVCISPKGSDRGWEIPSTMGNIINLWTPSGAVDLVGQIVGQPLDYTPKPVPEPKPLAPIDADVRSNRDNEKDKISASKTRSKPKRRKQTATQKKRKTTKRARPRKNHEIPQRELDIDFRDPDG